MTSYNYLPSATVTNSSQTSAPSWGPQVGALTQAFQGAQNAYGQQQALGNYNGDYVAGPTAGQYGAVNQAYDFAQGPAASGVGNTQINQGQGLLSNYGTGTNSANALYNFANQNQTQNTLDTANQFANNPMLQQMTDAATFAGNRNAAENDIPNLYRGAAASGNLNSDRAALAQGVIQRGLGENAQNIYANLAGNAWNQGLGAAQTQNQQSLGALSNAGQLGASLGGAGSSMMSQGINDQASLSNLYSGAGSAEQQLNQAPLNNALAKYQGAIQNMWSPVNNLYGIAGANNWGNTTTGTSTTTGISPQANTPSSPNAAGILGGLMGVGGAVAGLGTGGGATLGGAALGNLFARFGNSQST